MAPSSRMREKDFLKAVVGRARVLGWRIFHPLPAMVRDRHLTAQLGHPGLPDLVLLRPPRLIFAELKVGHNYPSRDQREWLDGLGRVEGIEVYVWREIDWPDKVEAALR